MRTFTDLDYKNFAPMWDEVLIELTPPKKQIGSIILPEMVKEQGQFTMVVGKLVKKGPTAFKYAMDGKTHDMDVPEGSIVVFRPYAGDLHEAQDHSKEGPMYRIMTARSIVGVLKGE